MIKDLSVIKGTLAIIFLSAFPIFALAAKPDPSRLPQNTPLLTPNTNGSMPNISGSIESNLPGAAVEVVPGSDQNPSQGGGEEPGAQEESQAAGSESEAPATAAASNGRVWVVVLAGILIVLLGYGLWKKGYFKQNEPKE